MSSPTPLTAARPQLVTTRREVRLLVAAARRQGKSIGLVPTMGALHAGHLSLVEASAAECDFTVVTIFVNPTQFEPDEDLARYPRTLEADLAALGQYGVDLVFAPSDEEMYPQGHSTFVEPPLVAQPLEGRCRPGHFRGVATIVLKLFHAVPADVAFFGQKDYQQSLVIRRMVEDLDVPVEIRAGPIIREPDGLALSSRNAYLSPQERITAVAISGSLDLAAKLVRDGERDAAGIIAKMRYLLAEAGVSRIDYIALADPETLAEVPTVEGPTMALIAAHVGHTRLIDNQQIG